jgi:uncharacterized surface protein with fasciclin (FAS1) repeats
VKTFAKQFFLLLERKWGRIIRFEFGIPRNYILMYAEKEKFILNLNPNQMIRKSTLYLLVCSIFCLMSSCDDDEKSGTVTDTVLKELETNPDFDTFLQAVERLELEDAFSSVTPYTVFVPTNTAFSLAGINVATMDSTELSHIIRYHIVGSYHTSPAKGIGSYTSSANSSAKLTTTLTLPDEPRSKLFISSGTESFINVDAKIIESDVIKENGIVHTIDQVLFPPDAKITTVIDDQPDLGLFMYAITKAGLKGELESADYTVLAPTDAAMIAAGFTTTGDIDALTAAQVKDLVLYHMIRKDRVILSTDMANGEVPTQLETSQGSDIYRTLTVNAASTAVTDGNGDTATVTDANLIAINGVVHIIDQVLMFQ